MGVYCNPLILSLRSQRQAVLCKVKVNVGYLQSKFQTIQGYTRRPCIKNSNNIMVINRGNLIRTGKGVQ